MGKQILETGMEHWILANKTSTVKPSSLERLKVSFKQLKQYPIASEPLSALTSDDIQEYLGQLRDHGYALTTIRKQHALLTEYLKYAHGRGDILLPIYLNVKLPRESSCQKHRKQVEAYSDAEQRALRRVFKTLSHPLYAAAMLMLEEGLRIGEVLALTWGDILWQRKALRVNKTVIRLTTQHNMTYVQDGAKSQTSNRIIPLTDESIEILNRLEQNGTDYIFGGYTYEAVRYHLSQACQKAGVPYKGTHIFRHTFATNCYNRGCDVKILSKLLGHSEVSITYDIYIHLYGDALDEMRQVMG